MAGGHYVESTVQYWLTSVEILDLETLTWFYGRELPLTIQGASTVQIDDTFLLVGGASHFDPLDTIYKLNPETFEWVEQQEKLEVARSKRPALTLVDQDFLDCN